MNTKTNTHEISTIIKMGSLLIFSPRKTEILNIYFRAAEHTFFELNNYSARQCGSYPVGMVLFAFSCLWVRMDESLSLYVGCDKHLYSPK